MQLLYGLRVEHALSIQAKFNELFPVVKLFQQAVLLVNVAADKHIHEAVARAPPFINLFSTNLILLTVFNHLVDAPADVI